MPEVAAISIPGTSFDTEGAGKGVPAVSYIRALAEMRELRIPFVTPQLYELESGDLLIKDAPLLAEGEWTDSAVQTPLFYTAKALEEFASNWRKKIGFNRHLKGQPRDKSNEVSEAINPHYGQFADDTGAVHNAILSDILVYGDNPSGRAMQELIKRNQIKYLSVEHGGEEEYNPITGRMESKTLEFYGYAHVNKGACKVCRVNEAPMLKKDDSLEGLQSLLQKALDDKFALSSTPDGKFAASTWIVMTFPDRVIYSQDGKKFEIPFMMDNGAITLGTPLEVEEVYVEKKALELFPGADPRELMAAIQKKQDRTMATEKELEAQITAKDARIKELEAAAQKPTVEIPKELAELPGQIKELAAVPGLLRELAARVDALEKDGTPATGAGAAKELEALPEFYVPVDRKKGIVGAQ